MGRLSARKEQEQLSIRAAEQNVCYRTAPARVRSGIMPAPVERTPGGHIRVVADNLSTVQALQTVWVSSSDQKADLARQVDRLRTFAAGKGYEPVEVLGEIGSEVNEGQSRLLNLQATPTVGRIVVEQRGRLTRFGVECIDCALVAA